jgi:hypothetical protein
MSDVKRMNALLFSVVILAAVDAAGCVCVGFAPKTAFKGADVVFLGEVLEDGNDVIRLRVVDRYKGPAEENLEVSLLRDTSCSYGGATPPGSRHLIYAWRDENGMLTASQCSRSGPEARRACDLRYLRSRAWWWRSPLSSLRILQRLGVNRQPCPVP